VNSVTEGKDEELTSKVDDLLNIPKAKENTQKLMPSPNLILMK
jgi:hypothetical protein